VGCIEATLARVEWQGKGKEGLGVNGKSPMSGMELQQYWEREEGRGELREWNISRIWCLKYAARFLFE